MAQFSHTDLGIGMFTGVVTVQWPREIAQVFGSRILQEAQNGPQTRKKKKAKRKYGELWSYKIWRSGSNF